MGALRDGLLCKVLHVDVRVVLQLKERWLNERINGDGTEVVVLHHPCDRPTRAEAHIRNGVLRCLGQEGHDELHDLVWGHDAGDLRQHVEGRYAVRVARALGVLLHQLRQKVFHSPLCAERLGDVLKVYDGRLPHRVDRITEAREEQRLQLGLEHFNAEELGELRHLLHDALPDAPVIVHDEVLDGVQEGVHEAVDTQHLAYKPRVRDNVEPHVVELVLHEV
mmetsp:Transcript_23916/g.75192  ORF Transcript_23916/g.75192 Transcript_23916/m.75192 type:complete len:222 (-) Transcript_23916:1167-1832(-)